MPDHDVSEHELSQALAQLRSQCPAGDPQLFPVLQRLAKRYFELHRYAEARSVLSESLEIRTTALGENHYMVAESIAQLASIEAALHDHSSAIALLRRAQRVVEAYGRERHPQLAALLNQLVETLFADNRFAEAMDFCKRALELLGGNPYGVFGQANLLTQQTLLNCCRDNIARKRYLQRLKLVLLA